MSNPFSIVKDSSIWVNSKDHSASTGRDPMLRFGIVKKAFNDEETGELRFLVEVQNQNDKIEVNCRMLRRFGGVYNYEDYIPHGYNYNDKPDDVEAFDAKAGDVVLIGQLNGQGREGVIIGGLTHAARETEIQADDGPQYISEFNGIETEINSDGEYTVTFKGLPTNIDALDDAPDDTIADAEYDEDVGTSYFMFDKEGSYTVSDNADDEQVFKIDKAEGTITIDSGNINLKMEKDSEAVSLTSKTLTCDVEDTVEINTKEFNITSDTSAFIKSPKVAIGSDSVELLDQLAQLIDALGKVQPISPVGPCTPLLSTPQWPEVEAIKAKIKEITGSF